MGGPGGGRRVDREAIPETGQENGREVSRESNQQMDHEMGREEVQEMSQEVGQQEQSQETVLEVPRVGASGRSPSQSLRRAAREPHAHMAGGGGRI